MNLHAKLQFVGSDAAKLLDELLDQDPLVHRGTVHGAADVNNLGGAANQDE